MKKQKKWYDYLWIVSLLYLVLGFFNIMFAWLETEKMVRLFMDSVSTLSSFRIF